MYDCDHSLFLTLNFDGGTAMDRLMLLASGKLTWMPLYILILWLVWRRVGLRNLLYFILLVVASVALTDMIAGIFKHSGLLKGLLPDFSPRLRPMYTPELEGVVHVVRYGGRFGTVSAHAATTVSIAILSAGIVRRRWFTALAIVWVALVSYSRIYLAYHFPLDIAWGLLLGLTLGGCALFLFRIRERREQNDAESPRRV